jgi:hypothetical protein
MGETIIFAEQEEVSEETVTVLPLVPRKYNIPLSRTFIIPTLMTYYVLSLHAGVSKSMGKRDAIDYPRG